MSSTPTDPTTPPSTDPSTPPSTDPSTPPSTDPSTKPDDKTGKGKEAAKYRTRLREVEAARDTLASRLEAAQRAEVLRLAGSTLLVGEDVFTLGRVELAELLNDAGDVDPAKVQAVASRVAKARPGVARPSREYGQGSRGGFAASGSDWSAAFARK